MKILFAQLILFLSAISSLGYSQCDIHNIQLYNIVCDEAEQFALDLDFSHDDVGNQGFQVIGNGNFYGNFEYEDLPITLQNAGNCFTDYEFIVRDNENLSCNSSIELGEICCAEDCNLEINTIEFTDCMDGYNNITVDFNLQYYYNDTVLVTTSLGNTYSALLQDNSIYIENFESGSEPVIELIFSNPDGSCSVSYQYLNNCICHISDIEATVIDCDPEAMQYFVQFDFDHNMTSDSFLLGGNMVFSGSFGYNELPVTVGPYSFNDAVSVNYLIQDSESVFCFDGVVLGIIDDCSIACNQEIVDVAIGECNGAMRDITFILETEHEGDSGFEAYINGEYYSSYAYGADNYTISVPSTCGETLVLTISDASNSDCTATYNISGVLCCECDISDFDYNVDCNNEMLTYSFSGQNVSETYHIAITDFDFILYEETRAYDVEPHTISIDSWNVSEVEVTITDSESENCIITEIINIDCNGSQCIDNVEVEIKDCSDDTFTARISFEHTLAEGSFTIRGNGTEYGTFMYGEDYYDIEGLTSDCTTIYEFVVIDSEDNSCQDYIDVDYPICCTTCIENITIDYLGCNASGNMEVVINFDYLFNSNAYFTLSLNGNDESYSFVDLPLTLSVAPGNQTIVISADYCVRESNLFIECNECSASNIQYEIIDCEDEHSTIKLYGDFNLGTSFSLSLNGEVEGIYDAADTIIIDNLDYNRINQLQFASEDYEACVIDYEIEPFMCDVAVDDKEFSELVIFQRDNFLYIKDDAILTNVHLYNIQGALVAQIDRDVRKINLSNILAGIYIIELRTEDAYSIRRVWIH